MNKIALILALSLTAGVIATPVRADRTSHVTFFYTNLRTLCGHSYQGEVVESIESDATWRESLIIMGEVDCSDNIIKIPLAVGEDTSRTWIITSGGGG